MWSTTGFNTGSPTIFVIVNDIKESSTVLNFTLFADDTNAFFSDSCYRNLYKVANEELVRVVDWMKANKLSLNIKKTKHMIFESRRRNYQRMEGLNNIIIEGNIVEQVKNFKFLGVQFDENLTWHHQLAYLNKRVARGVGVLRRARMVLTNAEMGMLYNSIIMPHLNYCNSVWGNTHLSILTPLIMIQKRAIRVVAGVGWQDHTEPLFQQYKLLKLLDINKLQNAIIGFKFINSMLPLTLRHCFNLNRDYHDHNTRHHSDLHVEFRRTNIAQRSVGYRAALVWNGLTNEQKNIDDLQQFKNKLKQTMIESYNRII